MAVAIQAYYDSSGKSDDQNARFLTLAGYAGTLTAWQQFEKRWKEILQSHGCRYLHMREAHLLQGEFASTNGWTHEKVKGLLQNLINECLSETGWGSFKGEFYGASCTINLKDYKRICSDMPTHKLKEPEAICVDHVATIALKALPENPSMPFGKEGTVELFFDKGESFMNKVDRVWRSKSHDKLEGPLQLVSNIASADMHKTIGLQAADFLAWHTNRCYTHGLSEASGAFAGVARVLSTPTYDRYCDYEYLKILQTSSPP